MLAEERRDRLLELVRARRFASLPELTKELAVSESTIRRDVEQLEEQGCATRIHGGVLYAGQSPTLPHFEAGQSTHWPEKRAIARRTAELIEDGDTVLLDGGTTTYEVARLLVGRPLHVVTNSLPVANLFAADTASDLVMIGGNICPRTGVAQGPYADGMLSTLRVRRTILSVAAINDEGYFNNNLLLVNTERAMMKAADEVTVVADHSKFSRSSLAHLCELGGVRRVIADSDVPASWVEKMHQAGVEMVLVEAEPEKKGRSD